MDERGKSPPSVDELGKPAQGDFAPAHGSKLPNIEGDEWAVEPVVVATATPSTTTFHERPAPKRSLGSSVTSEADRSEEELIDRARPQLSRRPAALIVSGLALGFLGARLLRR